MQQRMAKNSLNLFRTLLLGITGSSFAYCNLHSRESLPKTHFGKLYGNDGQAHVSLLATSASNHDKDEHDVTRKATTSRSFATKVDRYYQNHQEIPIPAIVHDSLDRLLLDCKDHDTKTSDKILIIGDVHGCLDELKLLVEKASCLHNAGQSFRAVVLVGDLCNKGPYSSEVIQYVRSQPNWYTVRGNHDNAGLFAALGDKNRRSQPKYHWVEKLSDEDVEWMAELPYSIRISRHLLNRSNDVLVVHAGLIPDKHLKDQDVKTMTTLRDVSITHKKDGMLTYSFLEKGATSSHEKSAAWSKMWTGPETIIFGHDAKRGLQQEKFAIGLDSGACYGNRLSSIVLPDEVIVSVDSDRIYCPISNKKESK